MRVKVFWIGQDGRLGIIPRPRGGDWLDDEICSLRAQGVEMLVSLLTVDERVELELADEEQACTTHSIEFVSFPIEDRSVPAQDAAALALIDKLHARWERGATIVIHCRAGIGRAGLLAAAILTRNGCAPAQAISFVSHCRGCAIPDTAEQEAWIHRLADSRPTFDLQVDG